MEKNNRQAFIVGLFVVIALLIFVAGVLTLGGQKKTFESKVRINAVFEDVQGLQKGNNVWLAGVKIGTVGKVSLKGSSGVEVAMDIDEDALEYIPKDVMAKVGSEGFIGNKIVVLYGGTSKEQIAENEMVRVERGTSVDDIMATFQQNNKNLLEITGNISKVAARLEAGQGSIGKLLKEETLVNNLQSVINTLSRAADNANALTANVSKYTAQLQKEGSLAYDMVNDTVVFNQLRATALQLKEFSESANIVSGNLVEATNKINQVTDKLGSNSSPAGVLLNDEEAGRDLKATLSNLEASSKKLDENLEALQHNFLLRGFFKKKAKEEKKD